jgi:hypothetical protein
MMLLVEGEQGSSEIGHQLADLLVAGTGNI